MAEDTRLIRWTNGWRSMDDAPRDNTWILCWIGKSCGQPPRPIVLRWGPFPKIPYIVSWTDGEMHHYEPLLWQPTPGSPEQKPSI